MRGMNPTLRGFLIILLVAAAITALQLEAGLVLVLWVVRVLFLIAIVYFLYRLWRQRRSEIAMWSARSRAVFYGAAALAIVDVVAAFVLPWPSGVAETLVFFFVLAAAAFAMWRVWSHEHSYGY